MNVLLVSQCDKRALTETRRILDQFAERRGDRTWQTPITRDGLETLRRLLRKTARKNTAVACHWIRGLDRSELLWIVGDRRAFNEVGATPTNVTQRNVLRQEDENNWHSGDLIRLLSDMSGLLHDLGKAITAFQMRLQGHLSGRNIVRHEWVSLRLFEAFVGADDDATWLARLVNPTADDDARWVAHLRRDGLDDAPLPSPFAAMQNAPLAQALGWLVLTHHRLPVMPRAEDFQMSALNGLLMRVQPEWNERAFSTADKASLRPYWQFDHGLPVTHPAWRQRASRLAKGLQGKLPALPAPLANPFVMHLARLCLMLADHHYSSLEGDEHPERLKVAKPSALLANTSRKDGRPNQSLDEHLLGVARHSAEVARFLPQFGRHLPHLAKSKRLKQRSADERFRWQDKAFDMAVAMRARSVDQGAFVVSMASTGCGKTLANARMMYGLSDPDLGMRCAFALGLRTLTLQTGKAFKDRLGLSGDDLAIRVGGSASRALFEHHERLAEASGSASNQALLDEDSHVLFEGQATLHPMLRRAVADPQVRALLLAPVLVCTIDHLTPATESQRGGRQIAPMLRLMSGDLVLDEPDDFDLADLPALTRLVHWAGLLGSRVLLSSATLPPTLVQGLFEAYRDGRKHYQRNCGAQPGGADEPAAICCAWVDEFHQAAHDCVDASAFERAHADFATRRCKELTRLASAPRRRAQLLPLVGAASANQDPLTDLAETFATQARDASLALHVQHHGTDPTTGKRVSFGLIRMANIESLCEVALALFRVGSPPGTRIHLCVYHSRHPLLVRSAIEAQLDGCLNRHEPEAVFRRRDIAAKLMQSEEADHLFIVLGSPVTEVGRDHSYDWAVVEPSSMRSLIQLAGRVRRHQPGVVDRPNISIFSRNLRSLRYPGKAAYCRPGFEEDSDSFRLASHDLHALLQPGDYAVVDARPRIFSRPTAALDARGNLVDLEHVRMRATMLPRQITAQARPGTRVRRSSGVPAATLNAATWWTQAPHDVLLSAVLQQRQPFREEPWPPDVTLVLLPDDGMDRAAVHEIREEPDHRSISVLIDRSKCEHLPDAAVHGPRISVWGVTSYVDALTALASELDIAPAECAWRFGQVTVRPSPRGWRYHPALGFSQRR